MEIGKKEYEDMEWQMDDHVVAQKILDCLEKYNCLSKKGKVFKKKYFMDLDKEGYLDDELKNKEDKTAQPKVQGR